MVAYSNSREKADLYRRQNALTASPGELTLMLYDGCVRDINAAKMYLNAKDIEKTNEMLLKAQAIVAELQRTLDMRYEVSEGLNSLYQFVLEQLRDCNIKKDVKSADTALEIMSDLRDTWREAVRLNRQQNGFMGGSI